MTFPIIISGNLGKNQEVQIPKIKTLENYTHVPVNEFEMHFRENLNTNPNIGLFTAADLIKSFYNFDNESEKNKQMVIASVEDPDFGSLKNWFKSLFKK